jgi:hypothetical protein
MNLKQLKAALDAAAAALKEAPEDKDLKSKWSAAKTAYDAAVAEASEDDDEDEGEDEEDDSEDKPKKKKKKTSDSGNQDDEGDETEEQDNLDEVLKDQKKAKNYIKALRKENAKYRTKGKNLEDRLGKLEKGLKGLAGGEDEDNLTAEEKLLATTQRVQISAYENVILEQAIDHGISGKDGRKLFKFYVSEAAQELGEGEELSDEDIALIATKVKKMTGGKTVAKTSVNGKKASGNSDEAPDPEETDNVTLDQFCAMNITQKTKLHSEDPATYQRLFNEQVRKRRL